MVSFERTMELSKWSKWKMVKLIEFWNGHTMDAYGHKMKMELSS